MGWVSPPVPPITDPAARARHRAHLVSVLGYDPAIQRKPNGQTWRFIWRAMKRSAR